MWNDIELMRQCVKQFMWNNIYGVAGAAVHEMESSSGKSSINQSIFIHTQYELNHSLQVAGSPLLTTTADPLWDTELLN